MHAHENAVRLADNAICPSKLDYRSLLRQNVGVEQDLTRGSVDIQRLPGYSALRTHLVCDGLDLSGAEECLQLWHVEVTDSDTPAESVSRVRRNVMRRLASQAHRSVVSPSSTMQSGYLGRRGGDGG